MRSDRRRWDLLEHHRRRAGGGEHVEGVEGDGERREVEGVGGGVGVAKGGGEERGENDTTLSGTRDAGSGTVGR
jgi:hypothetical protein